MNFVKDETGQGRYRIWGSISSCSEGASLVLFGGEKPHIGTVVLTIPRQSLKKGSSSLSTTSSVINITGHKDEVIAREAGERVALFMRCPVSVTAGIHIQEAIPEELDILMENARSLVDLLLQALEREMR